MSFFSFSVALSLAHSCFAFVLSQHSNVEQVWVTNGIPGTYVISVDGAQVPQGPQPYALAVRGMFTSADLFAGVAPSIVESLLPTTNGSPVIAIVGSGYVHQNTGM